jgi:hypothetical protein
MGGDVDVTRSASEYAFESAAKSEGGDVLGRCVQMSDGAVQRQ